MWNAHIFEEFQVARKKAHTCRLHEVYMSTFTLPSPWMKIASNANRCSGGDCCRSRRTHGGADADMPTCHWSCVIITSKTSRDIGMTLAWHPFVSHCIHCFIFCLFQHTATNHPRPSEHAIVTFCSLSSFISKYLLHDSLIVHPRCENTWHDNFGKEIDLWASLCPIDVSNKPEAEELAGMGIARSSSSFQVLIVTPDTSEEALSSKVVQPVCVRFTIPKCNVWNLLLFLWH